MPVKLAALNKSGWTPITGSDLNRLGCPRSIIWPWWPNCSGGDKAEQAYRRSDALEKRRKMMEAWAEFCEEKASSKVVQIRKRMSS